MKKLASVMLVLLLCVTLVACGGPDKQPAIDAYNTLANNYNTFANIANENLAAWDAEDIEEHTEAERKMLEEMKR